MNKESAGKNKLFSPRNLLIAFIVIIMLLFIFNYFYSQLFFGKRFFDSNFSLGSLYQSREGSNDFTCKGKNYGTCPECNKCEKDNDGIHHCVVNSLDYCNNGDSICRSSECPICKPDCSNVQIPNCKNKKCIFADYPKDKTLCVCIDDNNCRGGYFPGFDCYKELCPQGGCDNECVGCAANNIDGKPSCRFKDGFKCTLDNRGSNDNPNNNFMCSKGECVVSDKCTPGTRCINKEGKESWCNADGKCLDCKPGDPCGNGNSICNLHGVCPTCETDFINCGSGKDEECTECFDDDNDGKGECRAKTPYPVYCDNGKSLCSKPGEKDIGLVICPVCEERCQDYIPPRVCYKVANEAKCVTRPIT